MVTSASGLAGNFGQASCSAAKMALVGLMHTLGIEGGRRDVRVNCLAPVGLTRMNAQFLSDEERCIFDPAKIAPGVVFLASDGAPMRVVLMGGGGSFERSYTTFTRGCLLEEGTAEELSGRFETISDRRQKFIPNDANAQVLNEILNLK
jgi:NAD(P)-dependent dehydrogenase (short-subunit alcohol dehydrogenase family)